MNREQTRAFNKRLRRLRVTAMGAAEPIKLGSFNIIGKAANDNIADPALAALSLENTFEKTHAFLFPPFDPKDRAASLRAEYELFSIGVAKQTVPNVRVMPTIIMDDGSYTPMINTLIQFVNAGMSKDLVLTPGLDGRRADNPIVTIPDVQHIALGYFDIVRSTNRTLLDLAAKEVLAARLAAHRPLPPYREFDKHTYSGGDLSAKPAWTEAIFVSASSDNLRVCHDGYDFSAHLARQGDGAVWGGGDRHGMGFVYKGYKDAEGPWIAGFSTPPIIKAETKFGRIPVGCDYWEIVRDIFRRKHQMIMQSDKLNVHAGGWGTHDELLTAVIMKRLFPELMKDKTIDIYGPDLHSGSRYPGGPYWDIIGNSFMGKDFWNAITKNHDAFAEDGIFLTTSMDEHIKLSADLKRQTLAARSASRARGLHAT